MLIQNILYSGSRLSGAWLVVCHVSRYCSRDVKKVCMYIREVKIVTNCWIFEGKTYKSKYCSQVYSNFYHVLWQQVLIMCRISDNACRYDGQEMSKKCLRNRQKNKSRGFHCVRSGQTGHKVPYPLSVLSSRLH